MHDLFKIDNHTHFLELCWYGDQLIIGTVSKIMHKLLKWLEKVKCKKLWKGLLVTYNVCVHVQCMCTCSSPKWNKNTVSSFIHLLYSFKCAYMECTAFSCQNQLFEANMYLCPSSGIKFKDLVKSLVASYRECNRFSLNCFHFPYRYYHYLLVLLLFQFIH